MGGYPIGKFYFIDKFRENCYVQFNNFLETELNKLVSG